MKAVQVDSWKLMPCAPDVCQTCAVDHRAEAPHNQQSLYYQYKFYGEHGRWPTWRDAMAHCSDRIKKLWTRELLKMGQKIDGEAPPDVAP